MHGYVMLGIALVVGALLGSALQLIVDLRRIRKIIPIHPLCKTLEGCQKRMERECELARSLGYIAGSVEGSRQHWETLRTWGDQVFRPRVH